MSYKQKRFGWHFKLQQWTFGSDHERFNNFCPHFWLTIFCVMVSPFIGTWKLLLRAISAAVIPAEYFMKPFDYLAYLITKHTNQRYESARDIFAREATDWEAYQLFRNVYIWVPTYDQYGKFLHLATSTAFDKLRSGKQKMLLGCFKAWQNKNDDWKEILVANYKKDEEQKSKELKKKKDRRKNLATLAERTKLLVWLPLGIAAIYLSKWTALLVLVCLENPVGFFNILIAIGMFSVMILALIGTAFLFIKLIESDTNIARPFVVAGRTVAKPFKFIGRGFAEAGKFLWMNVKAFKENYCPGIEWED